MKTYVAKAETVQRDWCLVDATDKTLGRLASEIASRLRGKHKAEYTPHVDTGDHIVVVNAEKIRVTGNKLNDKIYYRHTGYIGNLKSIWISTRSGSSSQRSRACCPGIRWAAPCSVSCMFMQVRNTRTPPSSPKNSTSESGTDNRNGN